MEVEAFNICRLLRITPLGGLGHPTDMGRYIASGRINVCDWNTIPIDK